MPNKNPKTIYALRVNQWLETWDQVGFSKKERRTKPEPYFYTFSMSAKTLKDLSGIQRREKNRIGRENLGIQRRHDPERSNEISEYIQYGYPWSSLNRAQKRAHESENLRKPGWLPTAIIINILTGKDERYGVKVNPDDLIQINDLPNSNLTEITLPKSYTGKRNAYKGLEPVQVIDGQHRLYAFSDDIDDSYELPVVAFHGLDVSWEAYIFWAVNIKPKRINASLAFDLYPLLRSEDWVNLEESHKIYRETRSQELVEALWSNENSPWFERINMLGDSMPEKMVSQAAWVNALMTTLVRSTQTRANSIAGLYGSKIGEKNEVLKWSGAQQAAYIMYFGQQLIDAIKKSNAEWARTLRSEDDQEKLFGHKLDMAIYGKNSLLNTDQGIRGLLNVLNDLSVMCADEIDLKSWNTASQAGALDVEAVASAVKSLGKRDAIKKFIGDLANVITDYDWRTSNAVSLQSKPNEDLRREKLAFRGGSGYRELKSDLIKLVEQRGSKSIADAAKRVNKILKLYK